MKSKEFTKNLQEIGEVGHTSRASKSIVYISGLPSVRANEKVITEDGSVGMVYSITDEGIEALMFQSEDRIEAGKRVARTGDLFNIPVSDNLLGRVVDPLTKPLDGEGPIRGEKKMMRIEREAPGITERVEVNRPLETGVTAVDLMVPVGYGQREVIVGDAKTGKTTLLLQAISNQVKKGTVCIYVGISKESSALKEVEDYLKGVNAFEEVVMMVTTSNQNPTMHYIAPLSGMSVAEYFRDKGNDVLIVFDDLSNHAKAYREISLLLKNPPGREAYPGDIFHLHGALIERAGNIKDGEGGEVSITALPVAETLENDISGFIQTNLLSMTDGHIFFDINELKKGRNPAINISLSVSRAGNQTRDSIDKDVAGRIRSRLVNYRKVLKVNQFGAELSEENRKSLEFGRRIEVLLGQGTHELIRRTEQLFLFGLLFSDFWEDVQMKTMEDEVRKILKKIRDGVVVDPRDLEEKIDQMESVDELIPFCKKIAPELEKYL